MRMKQVSAAGYWEWLASFCFTEENGLELGSPHSPKLGNPLIKAFFFPYQLFMMLEDNGKGPNPTLFSDNFTMVEHTFTHQTTLIKLKECTECMFSDHNRRKLK